MPGHEEMSPGTDSLDSYLLHKRSTWEEQQETNLWHDIATWLECEAGCPCSPFQGHFRQPDYQSTLLPYMEIAVGVLFICHLLSNLLRKSRTDFLAQGQVLFLLQTVSPAPIDSQGC